MRRGTGKIVFWAAATVIGGSWLIRKTGLRVPGFSD